MTSLGHYIHRHRKALGLTQAQLARRVGVSRAAISAWECDTNTPLSQQLPKLAAALGTPVDELAGLAVDPITRRAPSPREQSAEPAEATPEQSTGCASTHPDAFSFEGAVVRAEVIDGQPWFVARDVCAALGIEWNGRVSAAIRDDWRGVSQFDTPGGTQELVIIAEGAVYKLAFRSRKPEAERFTDWVAGDVLPALRERGSYHVQPAPPETLPVALADDPIIVLRMQQIEAERRQRAIEAEQRAQLERLLRVESEQRHVRDELVRHQLAEEERRRRSAEILAGGHASVPANDLPDVPLRRLVWDLARKVIAHKVSEKTREHLRRHGRGPSKQQLRGLGQEAGTETWNPICEAVLTRHGVNLRVRRDNLRERGERVSLVDVAEQAGLMVELYDITREMWADWWIERGAA